MGEEQTRRSEEGLMSQGLVGLAGSRGADWPIGVVGGSTCGGGGVHLGVGRQLGREEKV